MGGEIDDSVGLVKVVFCYYFKFFSVEIVDYIKGIILLNNIDSVVFDYLKIELERDIELEEILRVFMLLKNGKVLGIDGFIKEFYLIFWDDIGF